MKLRTTKNLVFGIPEAEGEGRSLTKGMVEIFSDYLDVLPRIEGGKFIISGRKGVGKSALAKYFFDFANASEDDEHYATLIKANDLNLEHLIAHSENEPTKRSAFFEWVILCSIAKLLINSNYGEYTKEFGKLKDFLERNRGLVDIDKLKLLSAEAIASSKVNIAVLKHAFGGEISRYIKNNLDQASYYEMIYPLRDIILRLMSFEVCRNIRIKILFDDLDLMFENNTPSESELKSMFELIRIVRDYNTNIFEKQNVKIIVFLRSDIVSILESKYPDSAKIFSSYILRISWYSQQIYNQGRNSELPLQRFIEDRIARATSDIGKNEALKWTTLFDAEFRDSFKYVLDFTLFRPRDLLLFLNKFGDDDYTIPVSFSTANLVLRKYSSDFVNELRNELTLHFTNDQIQRIFDRVLPVISNARESAYDYSEAVVLFCKTLACEKEFAEDIIDELLKYGVLGLRKKDNHDLYFAYREETLPQKVLREPYDVVLSKAINSFYKR
jgi:hypothetical protein